MTSGRQDRGSGPATPERLFTPPPPGEDAERRTRPAQEAEACAAAEDHDPLPVRAPEKERGEAR